MTCRKVPYGKANDVKFGRLSGAAVAVLSATALTLTGCSSDEEQGAPAPEPAATSEAATPSATTEATPTPSKTPSANNAAGTVSCEQSPEEIVPTHFAVPELGIDSPVIPITTESYGGSMAPPKEQANTVAWWEEGPKPGSTEGNVVLTAHTYQVGGALGNKLYKENPIEEGDIIQIWDDENNTACYEFTSSTKFAAADYDPDSDTIYAFGTKPQVAIVVCWDHNKATDDWDSRVVFYAKTYQGESSTTV